MYAILDNFVGCFIDTFFKMINLNHFLLSYSLLSHLFIYASNLA